MLIIAEIALIEKMDYLPICHAVLSSNEQSFEIYLNSGNFNKEIGSQNNDDHDVVQNITSLLATPKTVAIGIRLLDMFIESCPVDVLKKKGNLWSTIVLKTCNNKREDIGFHVLNKIIKRSAEVPDLAKSFISSHISKIYDTILELPSSKSTYALNCMETILRVYPGASVAFRDTIEKFLWRNIDHVDYEIVQNTGRCLHIVQQIKVSGVQSFNPKIQWKKYQLQLIGGIHSVYNQMFANCVEMYDEEIEQEKLPWGADQIEFDFEPVQKIGQMYTRCRNLVTYLGITLREPFLMEKPILIKKIINVIVRGLSINTLMLERNNIADNIALSILLPELHTDLLNLLNVLITILRGHLRPYSELILCLMIEELKWTFARNENHKRLWSLREKVYDVISLWCKTFKSSNICETIAEYLFEYILSDITPTQIEFTLKVFSGAQENVSKKARRQLQNGKSDVINPHSIKNRTMPYFSENTSQKLIIAALRCFQEVILYTANFLKPTTLKLMQTSLTKISAIIYEPTQNPSHLYSNKNCRIEIYKALYSFLITTNHMCKPLTELILAIIHTAHVRDDSLEVGVCCGSLLKNLEKIVHPQKESLLFMIDGQNMGNIFTKICQQNLLVEVESNINITDAESDSFKNLQVLNTSSTSFENYNMGNDIQVQEIYKSIYQNNYEIINGYKDATDVGIMDSEESPAADHLHADIYALSRDMHKPSENIKNAQKFAELLSCVEDGSSIARQNATNNSNFSEPAKKKLKFSNEINKSGEMENLNKNNMNCDENYMLDEIASQFVDELE